MFPESRVYVPYEKRHRPEDLIVFCATMPALGAAYQHLANYSFDQHHGRFLTLFYPFMKVHVAGRGLPEIVYAILNRKCAIIREWHRDLYDPPTRVYVHTLVAKRVIRTQELRFWVLWD